MWKNLKLGTKIIISVFSLVVCLLALILYDFLGLIGEGIQEQMRARIDEARAVGNLIIQNRLEELRVIALAVSEDNAVRLSISIGSLQAKLSHYLEETTLQAQIDFLTITDRTGIVYARVNNPDEYGDSLTSDPFVKQSLDRLSAWGIEKIPFSQLEKENLLPKLGDQKTPVISALALKVTVPVYDKLRYHLLGTVTAGDLVSGNTLLINKMKEILEKECAVVIYQITMNQEGIPIASSLEEGSGVTLLSPAALEAALSGETDFYGEETLGGESYFVSVQPLQDRAGKIVGALKIGLLRKPFVIMRRAVIEHMLIFSGIGLILLFGSIMLVSRKITAPVKGLIRGTKTIEGGNLDFRMEIQSVDEVGQLTASFNQMVARLKIDEEEKEYNFRLQEILGKISPLFITAKDFDDAVNQTLSLSGKTINASRAYLFRIHDNGRKMDNTHEWVAEGVTSQIDNLQDFKASDAPWWMEQVRNNRIINVFDVSTLPEAERKILEPQGIVSILVIPIFIGGELEGFMGFDETRRKRHWSPPEITVLRTLAEIISRAIERKRAEEALRVSEETHRGIFTAATDTFLIFNQDGVIVDANPAACKMYGYPYQELIGLSGKDIVHPNFYHLFEEFKREVKTTGRFHAESVDIRKDGTTFDIEVRGTSFNYRGKDHLLAVIRDISNRKKIEKATHLAALGEIVGDMAHEINNPLMVISGEAELLLLNKKADPSYRKELKEIVEQCFRAKKIIEDLLRFSKPSRGESLPAHINDSIDQILDLIEHQYLLKNIQFVRKYAPDLPAILIDEKQIQEVFLNLLTNAGYAMPEGGIITLVTSHGSDNIRIDISDTGCGIPEENLDKIFEPFFTTREAGTGLGLAVSYGIVKMHGGKLTYASKPGEGTTATITLPLKSEDSE